MRLPSGAGLVYDSMLIVLNRSIERRDTLPLMLWGRLTAAATKSGHAVIITLRTPTPLPLILLRTTGIGCQHSCIVVLNLNASRIVQYFSQEVGESGLRWTRLCHHHGGDSGGDVVSLLQEMFALRYTPGVIKTQR